MDEDSSPLTADEQPRGRRFPATVYSRGVEPDPRFTLANERTFLAWIRTSLGLFAAGIGVHSLATSVPELVRQAMSLALVALGTLSGCSAYFRWMASERALREGKPLPGAGLSALLTVGAVAVGVLALAAVAK